jgi:hypothetical protein
VVAVHDSKFFDGKVGPTGKLPDGVVRPGDRGEVQLRIGRVDNSVLMDFGTNLSWFACPPSQARELAALLSEWADRVDEWNAMPSTQSGEL